MISVDMLEFQGNGTEGFFNENEQAIKGEIESGGTGVYKLTQDALGQFTAVQKVTEVDDGSTLGEDGRLLVAGDNENYLYVKFEV